MYQLRPRSLFIWLTAASLLLVLLILFTLSRLSAAVDELSQAQANRYQSYLLADTLRQSSDDLTRLARTYVVTGDPAYERQYWDVIAIRNGDKPLPEAYHRIYWDFVAAGEAKPRPDGRPTALLDMMKAAGFSEAEFAKLNEAKANSDGLVKTETIAMNAVKGRFDDGQGGFSKTAEPDLELARRLMHDSAYHAEKARIMKPVDAFYRLMEQRTEGAVQAAQAKKTFDLWAVWLAFAINLGRPGAGPGLHLSQAGADAGGRARHCGPGRTPGGQRQPGLPHRPGPRTQPAGPAAPDAAEPARADRRHTKPGRPAGRRCRATGPGGRHHPGAKPAAAGAGLRDGRRRRELCRRHP